LPTVRVVQRENEHIFREIVSRSSQNITTQDVPELLVISPRAARLNIPVTGSADIVLLPGYAKMCHVRAKCAVTYGMSSRDSITMSSFAEKTRIMALQREIMTISGRILERQELMIHDTLPPEILLAVYGALIILEEGI
jgi:hypothetical protein